MKCLCPKAVPLAVLILISLAAAQPSQQPKQEGLFGTKTAIPFSLKVDIYFLLENTSRLPDVAKLQPEGSIYATELNIPKTRFDAGFPGVNDRFEWFAIDSRSPVTPTTLVG